MRKWMRDRLKRRQKSQEPTAGRPAPLQPAYFGAPEEEPKTGASEITEMPPQSESADSEAAAESTTAPEPGNEATPDSAPGDARRPRRRRSRGGRGRRRSTPAKAAPAPPLAVVPADPTPVVPSAAAEPTPAPPRASKGLVVLAIGLPGSGKSSWFKRHNITPLSSDVIRALLFDDSNEQRYQELVFSNLRSMLRARLVARRPLNYVDATNLTPHDRHSWIKMAKDFGYEVQAVYFDVPLEVCLERNAKRQRVVEEDVMRRMSGKMKAPTFTEGFSKITVVKVKPKAESA